MLLLLALAAGAGAQIYRWVDERGITHPSNRPPTGTAVEVDEETALREAEAAFSARDYAKARAILTPLAERGNPRAQNGLRILYGRGLGVPQDLDQAGKNVSDARRTTRRMDRAIRRGPLTAPTQRRASTPTG